MDFERRVMAVIRAIPRGKVATYGQVAALAGNHRAARQVARVLHSSSEKQGLPWHRVINSRGGISLRRGRGFEEQRRRLAREGVRTGRTGLVDLVACLWEPAPAPTKAAGRFLRDLGPSGGLGDGRPEGGKAPRAGPTPAKGKSGKNRESGAGS